MEKEGWAVPSHPSSSRVSPRFATPWDTAAGFPKAVGVGVCTAYAVFRAEAVSRRGTRRDGERKGERARTNSRGEYTVEWRRLSRVEPGRVGRYPRLRVFKATC